MKLNIKIFLISILAVALGAYLSHQFSFDMSEALLAQAEAISYVITLVGVVVLFGWYNRKAVHPAEDVVDLPDNQKLQAKVMYYLLVINIINAAVLVCSTVESIQLMTGISLLVVLISPAIFRTMREK